MGVLKRERPLPAEAMEKILAAYPARAAIRWDVVDERVVLAVPKRFTRLDRWLQRVFPGPTHGFLALDALGSAAWLLCDGTRTGREVSEGIREQFGPDAEPADRRAATFLAGLLHRGYLRVFDGAVRADDPHRGLDAAAGFEIRECRRCGRRHPLKADPGTRYVCPGCGKLSRVPRAPGGLRHGETG